MPDANGRIKGTGWSRAGEAAWERAFGSDAASQECCEVEWPNGRCTNCPLLGVPHEPSDEVDEWLADRQAALDDGWEADNQAARDGYNPAR